MNSTYANHKFLKIIIIFVTCLFMAFSLAGCSKTTEKKKSKTTKKTKTTEITKMSVEKLYKITSDVEVAKKYKGKKIKVSGYYYININLENNSSIKYIQDSPAESNYAVEINDRRLIGEKYIGGEKLELVGEVTVDGGLVNFLADPDGITIDGEKAGQYFSSKKQTVEVTSIKDFVDNQDYFLGTVVKLHGKLIVDKGQFNNDDVFIQDEKTKTRLDLGTQHTELEDLISQGTDDVILTMCYVKHTWFGTYSSANEEDNIEYDARVFNILAKTDNITVKEKKLSLNKDYSHHVTVEDVTNDYDNLKGKLVSLDGYGGGSEYVSEREDMVAYKIYDEDLTHAVRIFPKNAKKYKLDFYFNLDHKYTMKGVLKTAKEGFIYLEVDEN